MKTLFLISTICLAVSISAFSQTDDIYFTPEKKSVFSEMAKEATDQPTELAWVKTNLKQYQKQRQTAFILQIAGTIATTSAFFIKEEQYQNIAIGGGSVLSLSGLVTLISAEKYLKKAGEPAPKIELHQ